MLRLMIETLQIRPISQIEHATNFEPNEVIEYIDYWWKLIKWGKFYSTYARALFKHN